MILSRENLNARRLARLGARRHRDGLANSIDALLGVAEQPGSRLRVHPDVGALTANAAMLRGLAEALRGPAPLRAEAIGDLEDVLTDGTGPVYGGDAQRLSRRLRRIAVDLAPGGGQLPQAA